jgi:hypothetical protein
MVDFLQFAIWQSGIARDAVSTAWREVLATGGAGGDSFFTIVSDGKETHAGNKF